MSCSYCHKRIENENNWRHKMCNCKGNGRLCCKASVCPCVVFGETARVVDEPCCPCACFWILGFAGCWAAMRIRGKIREKYSINGTWQKDCAVAYCCGMCALVQYAQEVDERKEKDKDGKKVRKTKKGDPDNEETTLDDLEDDPYY